VVTGCPLCAKDLDTTPHSVTGFTPAELTFGPARDLDTFVVDQQPEMNDHIPNALEDVFALHSAVLDVARRRQEEASAEHLQEVRGTPRHFPVGSYVLV